MYAGEKRNRNRILLEIAFLFITPVLLLYFEIIPREWYLGVLTIYTAFVLGVILKQQWSLRTLGIRTDNVSVCLIPYLLFTALGVCGLVSIAVLLDHERIPANLYMLFLGWSIPISVAQEFLYRGFLMHELGRVFNSPKMIIVLNACLFAFLHVLYSPPLLVLPIAFLGGIGFAWMYAKYPNLPLIALSHAILNFFALWYGFF